ncbi:cyclomaltodextrinase N-terminal domain-containing protein [Flammeovirga yaeyamensis]|uniref:Cyclomaltodextrinase N-terminal domain-containing protein n=1 Tax=Flammeovirga yaeyamensis TaxID=367791 RepID=A0AAX1N0Y4_9BACT|nr:glycoside hydrolase family 13 protein [Flammeovirga yaeyamensis]MBB3698389.1 glycosidase [Flammeovirga yaeyamensis]NMF34260.1 glycoside hydrolase family 13 protein [Flammeovirga yaeyamensis]QWG01243.1 cyclomaltodextrinase N-terminal domain-containing protein [Flammeovirga yaeyamensis]
MKSFRNYVITLMTVLLASFSVLASDATTTNSANNKSKAPVINQVEPAFWWAGMKTPSVMLMVHGVDLASTEVTIDAKDIKINEVKSLDNANYVFIDLDISKAKAGTYPITFTRGKKKTVINYELKERNKETKAQGLDQSDVMYLIMPDRFVNGNPDNDSSDKLVQKADRSDRGGRHGGDIAGVTSKLDYINDLGATTVWLTPFLENNQPGWSYHGYAITDFYQADARHGDNAEYKNMVSEAHKRDMKVVMDLVFNHIGNGHLWMKDLPSQDWIHQWKEFTKTNYKGETISDPNASEYDRKIMQEGWFDGHMPDLNQDNPYLAKYLMQASLWWIEYAGIDGIRMDTYPYNKKEMMSEWVSYVLNEYPDFYIVGETWLPGATWESYWKTGGKNRDGFNTTLKSISDFPVWDALNKTWRDHWSITEVYKTLTEDFLYDDAGQNKIFMDNHDVDRAFGSFKKDLPNMKLATTFLLTTRGIPQIFYGTEILMAKGGDHGDLREDFPGGWAGDERDAFTKEGRTDDENEYFDYIRTILQWRKNSEAITGKLKHWVPFNEVYAYQRYTDNSSVFVVINNNLDEQTFDTARFEEALKGKTSGKDILTGKTISFDGKMTIPAKTAYIIELK